jgi:hypothetical protein
MSFKPGRAHRDLAALLTTGTIFDTPFESGCTVTVSPLDHDAATLNFIALDSDGVECEFDIRMVTSLRGN